MPPTKCETTHRIENPPAARTLPCMHLIHPHAGLLTCWHVAHTTHSTHPVCPTNTPHGSHTWTQATRNLHAPSNDSMHSFMHIAHAYHVFHELHVPLAATQLTCLRATLSIFPTSSSQLLQQIGTITLVLYPHYCNPLTEICKDAHIFVSGFHSIDVKRLPVVSLFSQFTSFCNKTVTDLSQVTNFFISKNVFSTK